MTKGFLITIISLSVALAGVLIALIFAFVKIEKPLQTPSSPTLITIGEDKFLDTATVPGAESYVFKIDNVEFQSSNSAIRVTSIFLEARSYVVEVAAIAKKKKTTVHFQPL